MTSKESSVLRCQPSRSRRRAKSTAKSAGPAAIVACPAGPGGVKGEGKGRRMAATSAAVPAGELSVGGGRARRGGGGCGCAPPRARAGGRIGGKRRGGGGVPPPPGGGGGKRGGR